MSTGNIIVVLVVAVALAFDFTNGFHDTANAMATTIATGALKPRIAVGIAAILNFAGAFISITVAATVAKGIVDSGVVTPTVIYAGLVGAITWNLVTWWFGVPSSSSLVALAHGTNDAQKTMGTISLALIANGNLSGDNFHVPAWVVISCGAAIALGTYTGGWRIIKTLGTKVTQVRPPQGFSSEEVAATVILTSSHFGYPLSTTHVVSGAVTGSGVGRPGAQVDWAVAGRIVTGWLLTLPCAGATAAVVYGVTKLLGCGAVGPIAVTAILAIACSFLWRANNAQKVEPEEVVLVPEAEAVHA